jgi:hypothetical protein
MNYRSIGPSALGKHWIFFHRKLNDFNEQKPAYAKVATVTPKPLTVSFKVRYRIARPHSTATDTDEKVLGESYVKELRKVPLSEEE